MHIMIVEKMADISRYFHIYDVAQWPNIQCKNMSSKNMSSAESIPFAKYFVYSLAVEIEPQLLPMKMRLTCGRAKGLNLKSRQRRQATYADLERWGKNGSIHSLSEVAAPYHEQVHRESLESNITKTPLHSNLSND
jgi:hypothetical protein